MIRSAGTGSGIDIDLIIDTLVAAERDPLTARYNLRETEIQAEISAFGSLKGTLSDLQDTVEAMSSVSELVTRSVSSSDTDTFTATASGNAAIGDTTIQVNQLATYHKLISNSAFADADTAVGAGTLTIDIDGESFDVDIVGGSNNTLAGIRDAINDASDNVGVTATILTTDDGMGGSESRLVLTADESGEDNFITVAVSSDADGNDTDDAGLSSFLFNADKTGNMNEVQEALDASISIEGFTATSSTNVFTNALQGITITAVEADPGVDKTLSVSVDKSDIISKVQNFVTAFNGLNDTLAFLTDYDQEENEAGLLTGDSTVRTIESQIRRSISSAYGDGDFTILAELGITTNKDGSIEFDSTDLSDALDSDFDAVIELLAGDDGFAQSLESRLDFYLQSGDGAIATKNQTFLNQLEKLDEQRDRLELRIEALEERLLRQYTGLDILLSGFTSTGDFVSQQLDLIAEGLKKDG